MALMQITQPAARLSIFDGSDAVILSAGSLEATFVPELGMAGTSLLHRGDELLDRRAGLRAYRDTGAVMGIPLLHPWANRLSGDDYELHGRRVRLGREAPRDENGLPIHGLLPSRRWVVDSVDADADGAYLHASLDLLDDAFPFPHQVAIAVVLTRRRLGVSTTVTATGGAPVPVALGFHPFLRLPDVDRADWEIRLPLRRHLELDACGIPTGESRLREAVRFPLGGLAFDDAFDRIADGAAFSVCGGGRCVTVTHDEGFPVAQVYSPAGAQFICFEPMTAPVDALRSGLGLRRAVPRAPVTATFSIAIS